MANEILGAKNYLVLYSESAWGTKPETPNYVHLPVNEMGIQHAADYRQGNPFIGQFQRKHSTKRRGMPQGTISCPLYGYVPDVVGAGSGTGGKSLAEYLIDWAMVSHELTELPSKGAQWAEGPNVANKEWNGLRVNSATLAGSESDGAVTLSLDLMGKTEADLPAAQSVPNDRHRLLDMEFEDTVFSLDPIPISGTTEPPAPSTELGIESFSMQVQHGLIARYNNSRSPSLLLKTQRIVMLTIQIIKNTDYYDIKHRADEDMEFNASLVVKGLHDGSDSDNYTVGTCTFNRLNLQQPATTQGPAALSSQQLTFACLKPDNSDTDIAWAWSTAS